MTDTTISRPRQKERRNALRRHDDVLRAEAAERALLLAQSLIGANYQNRSERDGIRNFISCIQLVLQEPMAVVLLRRQSQDAAEYLVVYHTVLDPLVKDHFEEHLHTSFDSYVRKHNLFIPAEKINNKVFNIHTDYFVMMFRLVNFEREQGNPAEYHCLDNDSDDVQISEYLRYFNSSSQVLPHFVSDSMVKEFDKRSSGEYWHKGKIWRREQHVNLDYDFIASANSSIDFGRFYDEQFKKISAIFDESYESIRDSPLLKSNQFQPPNIMFCLRMFDRTTERMSELCKSQDGAYKYGVRGLIPKSQKRDIRAALKTLRQIQQDPSFEQFRCDPVAERFYFPKPTSNNITYQQLSEADFPPSGNAVFGGDSDFFWRMIDSEENFDVVCQEIEHAYGDQARAISDSVFCSGFISVANDPFIRARAMRLTHKKWIQGPRDIDFRRLVYYHYLMSMAAPGGGSMSSLVLPGRVSGSVWFTLGYYFTDQEPQHRRWLNCYHFYHNVATFFIRSIRGSAKRLYLAELKHLLHRIVNEVLPAMYGEIGIEKYLLLINAYFTLMCRVYPFALVELQHSSAALNASARERFDCEILGVNYHLIVVLKDNPYFESTTGATYITAETVASVLQ